ncbi:MAG: hypothetical protein OEY23_05825 [Acidimicrobiia bacterium]|nr:hypothetical protein [Acidimicrobiia bacterium]
MTLTAPAADVFVEEWGAAYGSPYLVADDGPYDVDDEAVPVEDGPDRILVHEPPAAWRERPAEALLAGGARGLAFVDGVRRGEATLYLAGADARGVAGAHGTGAVLVDGSGPPRIEQCRIARVAIFGNGAEVTLPALAGGWAWESHTILDSGADAPLAALQNRMRSAEGRLADELARAGWQVVVDGPLGFAHPAGLAVVGYVKTHHRALLAPGLHAQVPVIDGGQRTSLFAHRDRLSCYLRLSSRHGGGGPWGGIVRIEMPGGLDLDVARAAADRAAALLPRFAGVAHVDPRAPQNLQPVGALERELRHRLGDAALAARAVRSAAATLRARPASAGAAGGTDAGGRA